MLDWAVPTVIGVGFIVVAVFGALVLTLRTGYGPALTAIRRMNRRWFNPRTMRTAGQPGASASMIRHVGRTSGAPYATPVDVVPTETGFAVVLPYRTTADWVKNVLAAGAAVIETEGETYRVGDPRVVPVDQANRYFSAGQRRLHRLYGIGTVLLLTRVDVDTVTAADR